jgi:hypothetical protein
MRCSTRTAAVVQLDPHERRVDRSAQHTRQKCLSTEVSPSRRDNTLFRSLAGETLCCAKQQAFSDDTFCLATELVRHDVSLIHCRMHFLGQARCVHAVSGRRRLRTSFSRPAAECSADTSLATSGPNRTPSPHQLTQTLFGSLAQNGPNVAGSQGQLRDAILTGRLAWGHVLWEKAAAERGKCGLTCTPMARALVAPVERSIRKQRLGLPIVDRWSTAGRWCHDAART